MNVLVAGVGYTNLRDLSLGPALVPLLRRMDWPPGVEVHDLSYSAVAVLHWLQERPGHFQRAVFVSAVPRGREPGRVYCYRWNGSLPPAPEVQRRVEEAVTGVIGLDHLLVLAGYFGALPKEVILVEVEPEDLGWGPGFSPRVQASLREVVRAVRKGALYGWVPGKVGAEDGQE